MFKMFQFLSKMMKVLLNSEPYKESPLLLKPSSLYTLKFPLFSATPLGDNSLLVIIS